jgi:hypothetical protein
MYLAATTSLWGSKAAATSLQGSRAAARARWPHSQGVPEQKGSAVGVLVLCKTNRAMGRCFFGAQTVTAFPLCQVYLLAVHALCDSLHAALPMHAYLILCIVGCCMHMHMHMVTVQHSTCYIVWCHARLLCSCIHCGGVHSCLPHSCICWGMVVVCKHAVLRAFPLWPCLGRWHAFLTDVQDPKLTQALRLHGLCTVSWHGSASTAMACWLCGGASASLLAASCRWVVVLGLECTQACNLVHVRLVALPAAAWYCCIRGLWPTRLSSTVH